jgi:hypothetical protein
MKRRIMANLTVQTTEDPLVFHLVNYKGELVASATLTDANYASELQQVKPKEGKLNPHEVDMIQRALALMQERAEYLDKEIEALRKKITITLMAGEEWTNHYLCPNDDTRWDDTGSSYGSDDCPTCETDTMPYASTDNRNEDVVIHDKGMFDKAEGDGTSDKLKN